MTPIDHPVTDHVVTDYLVAAAAVGSATVGGVYLAFSWMVMPALRRLPPAAGVDAMQRINVAAVRLPFGTAFLGTAAAAVGVLLARVPQLPSTSALWHSAGAALYLAGMVATIGFHVPRNNRLAALPAGTAAERYWEIYLREWVPANTARAAASLLGAAALVIGNRW